MKRIGYLGPEGTFCEEASVKYIKSLEQRKVELIPYSTIHDLLLAVDKRKLDEASTSH